MFRCPDACRLQCMSPCHRVEEHAYRINKYVIKCLVFFSLLFPLRVILIQLEHCVFFTSLTVLFVIACTEIHNAEFHLWQFALCIVAQSKQTLPTHKHVSTLPCMHQYYLDTSDSSTHHLPLR